jgi:hypothetical protein
LKDFAAGVCGFLFVEEVDFARTDCQHLAFPDADNGATESSHKYGLRQHHAAIALVVSPVLLMVVVELYGGHEPGVRDVVGESGFVVLDFLL